MPHILCPFSRSCTVKRSDKHESVRIESEGDACSRALCCTSCTNSCQKCVIIEKHPANRLQVTDDFTASFAELVQVLGLKRCPRCGNACQKEDEDSCDHMRCICGMEFCWTCLADRTVIFHHGNHYHFPDCRFYSAYKGPLEFKTKCSACQQNGRPCKPPARPSRKVGFSDVCAGVWGRKASHHHPVIQNLFALSDRDEHIHSRC